MRPEHISTAPTRPPNGNYQPAIYEQHGLCTCTTPLHPSPVGECQHCHRLIDPHKDAA